MINTYVQGALKAFAAALAAAASYMLGVLGPEATFDSITFIQWLGLVPVVIATFGITWTVPNTVVE